MATVARTGFTHNMYELPFPKGYGEVGAVWLTVVYRDNALVEIGNHFAESESQTNGTAVAPCWL